MAYRGVSACWREAAVKDTFANSCSGILLLMLADKGQEEGNSSDEREFYSLPKRKIAMRLSLPEANGRVWTCDNLACDDSKVATVLFETDRMLFGDSQAYFVESSKGELLVIARDGISLDDDYSYGATHFAVIRLDVMKRDSY
ncbi:OLC1v1034436C1 [Oldenlandia corymbosa var. corymbosa]|uniref:OLC1v1034436C1 n=1 Tax=Oldenlandia corymbosa var. corymbosa TaxID=529605 RepID=A0AAV1CTR9_OLDCO|nr:OLC1v1034436C1 [Oldenlandia corymbosa var. corymbosa]